MPIIAVLIAVLVLFILLPTIIELPNAAEALSTFNLPSFYQAFAAGTFLVISFLSLTCIFTAYTVIRAIQRKIVSSLTVDWVDESGIAWINNTSSELIRFDVSVNYYSDCDINHEEENCTWKEKTGRFYVERSFELNNVGKWIRYKDYHIAPNTEVPIHLKNMASNNTYVSLSVAVSYINKDTTTWHMIVPALPKNIRTRYVVYRYAGALTSSPRQSDAAFDVGSENAAQCILV